MKLSKLSVALILMAIVSALKDAPNYKKTKRIQMRKSLGQAPENNEPEGHGSQNTSHSDQQLHPSFINKQPAIYAGSAQAAQQDPKDSINKRIVLWSAVVGIAAIIQIFITIAQWQVMEKTLKVDQRAWLTIRQSMLNSMLAVGENPSFYMRVQNSGKSPAMKVRSRVTFGIFESLPDGPIPPEHQIAGEVSSSLIAPGEYMRRPGELPTPLTVETMEKLKIKQLSVFTYGTISYSDIFDNEHRTIFCFFLPDISKTDLSPCQKWNEAD